MVKSLVRLALASEHTRTPLKRPDITAKALDGKGRRFRSVFDGAQLVLRETFGMELVELPAREKVTLTQRRTAVTQAQSQSAGSNATKTWVLRSVLPAEFRIPEIIGPSKTPSLEMESAYVGLYTFVVSLIALSGGRLEESRLERSLRRMNAGETTPVDQTARVLQKMEKQGYIVRIRETSGGEESIEYAVGSRGKVEIGRDGVAGLVRKVHGHEDNDAETQDDLNKRLDRSLQSWAIDPQEHSNARAATSNGRGGKGKGKTKGKRKATTNDDDDDSEDD